jgi:RNA polymerase sigma factor (TIGR02999 family)
MRRILVDHARRRGAGKRGGADLQRVPFDEGLDAPVDLRLDFDRLDRALEQLATFAPEKARVVDLRYFTGLSIQDTADVLDIAPATVKRHWTFARAWLFRAMSE